MTIRENIARILASLDIQGVQIVDEMPDRIAALDTKGQLLGHILAHPEHWMRDPQIAGRPIDPFHGRNVTASFRERCSPSLQVVTHPISQINPNHPPEAQFLEMDVDYSPPDGPLDFLRHSAEVIHNAVTRKLTDQTEVSRRLDARLGVSRMNLKEALDAGYKWGGQWSPSILVGFTVRLSKPMPFEKNPPPFDPNARVELMQNIAITLESTDDVELLKETVHA